MSLILDALNKSRNEAEEVPGLGAEHYREEPSKPWRRYLPWAGVAVALLLLAWFLIPGGEDPEGSVVTPVAELSRNIGSAATAVTGQLKERADQGRERRAVQAQPVPPPAPVAADDAPSTGVVVEPSPAAPEKKADTATDSAAIRALYEKRERAAQETPERVAQASQGAPPPAAAAGQPQGSATPSIREEPVDVEEVLRHAQQEVANSGLVDHPAPFLVDLSQQTKNAIPTILYQRHEYSSQAGRSSVTLNGKKVRVGGTPASGLEVDDILEDSVILSYRGTQFRLRALNSWVNL
ncbi:MAG: general secretion pathway protein GspB [Halioglobus sp.]|nr:general secretion pathway protein GspB [Halioglobus sp.]